MYELVVVIEGVDAFVVENVCFVEYSETEYSDSK